MELLFNRHKYEYFKRTLMIILCLIIITVTWISSYQEAKAILPVIMIGGIAVTATELALGATLLTAAGITLANPDSAYMAVYEMYKAGGELVTDVKNMSLNVANGVCKVTDSVWTRLKSYVTSKFSSGNNTQPVSWQSSEYYGYGGIDLGTEDHIMVNGVSYRVTFYLGESTIKLYMYDGNSIIGGYSWWRYYEGHDVDVDGSFAFLKDTGTDLELSIHVEYQDSNYVLSQSCMSMKSVVGLNYTQSTTVNYNGSGVTANPNYDIAQNGQRYVTVPSTYEDVVGKTSSEVIAQAPSTDTGTGTDTGTTTTNMSTADKTWWQTALDAVTHPLETIQHGISLAIDGIAFVVNGIWDVLKNIWEWLKTFFGELAKVIGLALNPVIEWLTSIKNAIVDGVISIVNTIAGTAEADITEDIKNYRLPDLFFLSLKVILATIRMLGRALIFIGTLTAITADGTMIPNNMIVGLNFMKNFNLPIGISIWSLTGILITFLWSLTVFKIVLKNVRIK